VTEHVKIETADGVVRSTLQRPEKKNALTSAMYDALSNAGIRERSPSWLT
jgi:enoyl-CoA hydratase/carnithine racemase